MEATYEIVCWKNAEIVINSVCQMKEKDRKVNSTLLNIFMEGFVRKDEQASMREERRGGRDIADIQTVEVDVQGVSATEGMKHDGATDNKKEINALCNKYGWTGSGIQIFYISEYDY